MRTFWVLMRWDPPENFSIFLVTDDLKVPKCGEAAAPPFRQKKFRPGKNRKVPGGVPPRRLRPAEAAVSATVSAKSQIHGTHASLTAPPWSHGSMGHPGRAPQPFKKKRRAGAACIWLCARRRLPRREAAGAVREGGFGTCAGIRTRAVRDR